MKQFDVVILTESRYINPAKINDYIQNVLTEDGLLQESLEELGLKVARKDWADPDFDWSSTKCAVFRTTWDYFDRFDEFKAWLDRVESFTEFINPVSQIRWNMDKWYLRDLKERGIRVVETKYINRGEDRSLSELIAETGWEEVILKPTIAGAALHTYRLNPENTGQHESIFRTLIENEDMMLQPFQYNIMEKGEVSFMVIGGKYTHSVLKRGKAGDFRVQDDFGGTLHEYNPSPEEIRFAEEVVKACDPMPAYARVDVMWDNEGELAVSEVELIEPELWFRRNKEAAEKLAEVVKIKLSP
jgi:glutathione synthase/RimK-type ligase-like ATP-grasp enzyme